MKTIKKTIWSFAPENTAKIFGFKDNGQDFLYWFVDKDGRVLAAHPFQSSVWKDCIVAGHVMELAEPGDQMDYIFKDGTRSTLVHKINKIFELPADEI